jgi:hypothetical protein
VTFDEFCDYFKDVSASIDGDEYFKLMMMNSIQTWHFTLEPFKKRI